MDGLIMYIFVALLFAILFTIYWTLIHPQKIIYDAFRRQGVPGEPFVPVFGQIRAIRQYRDTDRFMEFHSDLAKQHGNIYLFGYGPLIRLCINEPDMLADVLGRSHAHDYIKPPDFGILFKPLIGAHNLLVSEGPEHERARKMLNTAFHFDNLKSMVAIMGEHTVKMINEILNTSTENRKAFDLQTHFSNLTLTIIASCAFGKKFDTLARSEQIICQTFTTVIDAIERRSMRLVNQIPLLSVMPFFHKDVIDKGSQDISHFVEATIADRVEGKSTSVCANKDLLDILLSAADEKGQSFTNEEIKQQALTFVLAGHETTSDLMSWVMYVLATHNSVFRVCRDEVDRVVSNELIPTYEQLSELIVCEAVIKETLRLYPPAPFFFRQCIREHTIGSTDRRQLRIPVGTTVRINTWLLHRASEFWSRPNEFDYTRWLRDPTTGLKPKLAHPFCYLPFAAGSRNCIGQNFALLEAKVILALFIQRCNIEFVPGQKITPDVHITMRPKYGLFAYIGKRD